MHRYIGGDPAAVEGIIRRHGPMVLGVCRRVLGVGGSADAEDAFQATFLVFVRKAASIAKTGSLGCWLHGVAYRVASKARVLRAKRRLHERRAAEMTSTIAERGAAEHDLRPILDEELARLPAKYSRPLVLCYLEGKSKDQIAVELGWPHGTVSGRLARARELLRGRLSRRGLALPAALLAAALGPAAASAAVPASLLTSTFNAVGACAAGSLAAAAVSVQTLNLAQGVLHAMMLAKLKFVCLIVAALGLVSTGLGVAGWYALAGDGVAAAAAATSAATPRPTVVLTAQANEEQDKLLGSWHVVSAERNGQQPPEGERDAVMSMRINFGKETMTLSIGERETNFSYTLDSSKKPKQIELLNIERNEKAAGIYALEGDNLKLCVANSPNEPRPTEFATKAGVNHILLVLKRGQGPKPAPGAADRATEAANRARSQNNLKQIGLAFHSYHDTTNAFPTGAIYSKDGKPLLSWRVAILPYLDQDALFKSFKLDEPWDSEHNKKLVAQMPRTYELPGKKAEPGHTFYCVFTGQGSLFDGQKPSKLQTIVDGTSNTFLAVEAAASVLWTKPDDLPFDASKPLPKLGGFFKDGYNVLICDGSVRFISQNADEKVLKLFIQPADLTPVNYSDLDVKKK
jgi:RNA polymerase sigma factor (sigma-70 family)